MILTRTSGDAGYSRLVEIGAQAEDTIAARSPEAAVDAIRTQLAGEDEVIAVPESSWHRFIREPGFRKV